MRTITLPAIKWGKRKARSQMCEVFTEDGRIVGPELDVLRSCVDDDASGQGFLLDSSNQMRCEDGQWYQILWERSCFPVSLINRERNPDFKLLLTALYQEHKELAISKQFAQINKNAMTTFLWIISVVCSTFLIIAVLNFFK